MLIVNLSGLAASQYATRAGTIARMSSQSRQRANSQYNRRNYRPDPPRVRAKAPTRAAVPKAPPSPAQMEVDRARREEAQRKTSAMLTRMFAPTVRPGAGSRAFRNGVLVSDSRARQGFRYYNELERRQRQDKARRRRQQAAYREWLAEPRQQPGGVKWAAPAEFITPINVPIPMQLTPNAPIPGLPAAPSPGTSTTNIPGTTATIVPIVPVPVLTTDPGGRLQTAKERLGIRA